LLGAVESSGELLGCFAVAHWLPDRALKEVARWAAMGRGSAGQAELRGRVGFLVLWVVRDGGLGSKHPIKGVRHLLRGQLVRTGSSFVRDARRGSCR
jgi:hypothetical protein